MTSDDYESVKIGVAQTRGRKLKSTCLASVSQVVERDVKLAPEETDYKWHADIHGWPESKDDRKAIAQEIALKAKLDSATP